MPAILLAAGALSDLFAPQFGVAAVLYLGAISTTLLRHGRPAMRSFALIAAALVITRTVYGLSGVEDTDGGRAARFLEATVILSSLALVVRAVREHAQAEAAAETREKELRRAIEGANLAVFNWSVDTNQFTANARLYELYGKPAASGAQLVKNPLAFVHPDDQGWLREEFRDLLLTGRPVEAEYRLLLGDGSVRWVATHCQAVLEVDGRVSRLSGVMHEISDRKRAEKALHDREEQLRLAVEGGRLGLFHWNLQTDEFFANARMAEYVGIGQDPVSEPFGDYFERIHPADRPAIRGQYSTIVDPNQEVDTMETEYRVSKLNGEWRCLAAHSRSYRDARGNIVYLAGILRDVTAERQIRVAVDESEARLRAAIDAAQLGVFDWQMPADVIRVDRRFREMHGMRLDAESHEEIVAELNRAIHPLDRDRITREGRLAAAARCTVTLEYRILLDDGSVRWICSHGSFRPSEDGEGHCMSGVVKDITDRKLAEQTREEMLSRESAARREAEEACSHAEAANRAREEFLAMVSQELRAPLSPILGWAEALRRGGLGEGEIRQAVDIIERNTRSVAQIVSELLDASPSTSDKLDGLRVLAVDADFDSMEATSSLLARQGAEVRTASSADDALALLEGWTPHVIVADLSMVGRDGCDFLRTVRDETRSRERVATIALGALVQPDQRERALAAGFDGFTAKPADSRRLAAAIRMALTTRSTQNLRGA